VGECGEAAIAVVPGDSAQYVAGLRKIQVILCGILVNWKIGQG